MTSCRRRINTITLAMVGLSDSTPIDELQRKIMEYFNCRFKSTKGVYMVSWEARIHSLDRSKADLLEAPFLKNEIQRELMGMDGNKAPGPNWFMGKFA